MTNNLINFISYSLDLECNFEVLDNGEDKALVLYNGIKTIDYETFEDHIVDKGKYLGSYCEFKLVAIPNSVTHINCNALKNCKRLESVVVSEDNESYSSLDGVLYDKNKTKLYYVPPMVKMTELVIPDTVTEIDANAFMDSLQSDNDETLKTLVIHKDVAVIYLYNCNVESIVVSEDNEVYCSQNGVLFSKDKTKLYRFPERSPLTEYVIPDTVTEIAERAFDCCKNLKSVVIPSSVKRIGGMAFSHCLSLESVVIPDSINVIDYGTFMSCRNLKSINIPNSVTRINDSAFHSTGLESVVIPDSVIEIEEWAFRYSKLTNVAVSKNTIIGKDAFENIFDEVEINYY